MGAQFSTPRLRPFLIEGEEVFQHLLIGEIAGPAIRRSSRAVRHIANAIPESLGIMLW
jgi:hypothetical protein